MSLKTTPGTIVGDHVLLTGPISGTVETEDGRIIDVSPTAIAVADQDEADEISFLIGERHRLEGHPNDTERDEDNSVVQRPFVHDVPDKFKSRVTSQKSMGKAAPKTTTKKG